MAYKYEHLRTLTRDELIQLHDAESPSASTGILYYLDEIHRRDQMEIAQRTEQAGKTMLWIAGVTLAISVVATAAAVIGLLAP